MNILGMLDFGFLGAIDSLISSLSVVYIIFLLVAWITWYMFNSFTLLHIGRKAGLNNNEWMVFVPFARTIYRLNILDEQWWKMFFLEGYLVYAGLFVWIFSSLGLSAGTGVIFLMLILLAYGLGYLGYNILFMMNYYKAFNMNPILAFLLNPLFLWIIPVINILIAYTNLFIYEDGRYDSQHSAPELPSPVVAPPSPAPSTAGSIRGVKGMHADQVFTLPANEELIIGRDSTVSKIVITDKSPKVSRKHCGIIYDSQKDRYEVIDYSTNGTFTDKGGGLAANQPTPLPRGSVIYLGDRDNGFMLL